jgi:hypothetical protein
MHQDESNIERVRVELMISQFGSTIMLDTN